MTITNPCLRRVFLSSLSLLVSIPFVLPTNLRAQIDGTQISSQAVKRQKRGDEKSRRKIQVKIELENGSIIFATQMEGEPITIERNGSKIGIVPSVDVEGRIQLNYYDLSLDPFNARHTMRAELGDPEMLGSDAVFLGDSQGKKFRSGVWEFQVWAVHMSLPRRDPSTDSGKSSSGRGAGQIAASIPGGFEGGPGVCCITCPNTGTVCGCSVSTDCGSCCSDSCC